jgi:hypothetical protein
MSKTRTVTNLFSWVTKRNNDDSSGKAIQQNKDAIRDAILNSSKLKDWAHLESTFRVTTSAPVTAGGIDFTNGAAAVTGVEVSGVTPAWDTAGVSDEWTMELAGDDVDVEVLSVDSETAITFKHAYVTPGGGDLDDASYILFHRRYKLPVNFRALRKIIDLQLRTKMTKKTRAEIVEMGHEYSGAGTPDCYAIETKELVVSAQLATAQSQISELWLHPPPDTARQYDLVYQRWPQIPAFSDPDNEIIDWPDEFMSVLEAAIEVELARANSDTEQVELKKANLMDKVPWDTKADISGQDYDDDYIGMGSRRGLGTPLKVTVPSGFIQ